MQPNPLREGLEQERVPDPSCLVIFGASGDLTQRKLVPGLYSLAHEGLLPSGQTIVGIARADMTDEQFRAEMARRREKLHLSKNDNLIGCPLCTVTTPQPASSTQNQSNQQ